MTEACIITFSVLITSTCPPSKIKYSEQIAESICKHSAKRNIDPYLVLALMKHESNFNPRAFGGGTDRGLLQLNSVNRYKTNFENWRKRRGCDLYRIDCNIKIGTKFLAYYKNKSQTKKKKYHYIRHYNWNSKKHSKFVLWLVKAYKTAEPEILYLIKTGRYRKMKIR